MVAAPVVKLGYLFLKQISKPLATRIKNAAVANNFVRKYICIPIAQLYHHGDVIVRMRILGMGRPVDVKPLNEEMALTLGADILGELIVFGFGVGIVISEYNRSATKSRIAEEKLQQRLLDLERKQFDYGLELEHLRAQLREAERWRLVPPSVERLKERLLGAPKPPPPPESGGSPPSTSAETNKPKTDNEQKSGTSPTDGPRPKKAQNAAKPRPQQPAANRIQSATVLHPSRISSMENDFLSQAARTFFVRPSV